MKKESIQPPSGAPLHVMSPFNREATKRPLTCIPLRESAEDILERREGRSREARIYRVKLILLAFGDLVLVVGASFSVFYFFYDTLLSPILVPAVFSLPLLIGHRWARRLRSVCSKTTPHQTPEAPR